jgi:hypothetical protein
LAHHIVETGAPNVLVSEADGRLMRWFSVQDVLGALDARRHTTHNADAITARTAAHGSSSCFRRSIQEVFELE